MVTQRFRWISSIFGVEMFAAPPIMNLTVLRSSDIDRTARFYEAMGLVFSKHRHGNGPEHYASVVNGFVFEIYPLGTSPSTVGTRIGFSVDDVDSVIEMLIAAGGTVVSDPHNSEWGRCAVVKDPDCHSVELVTPPNRDEIVATTRTSTGVMKETHTQGMSPGDFNRDVNE